MFLLFLRGKGGGSGGITLLLSFFQVYRAIKIFLQGGTHRKIGLPFFLWGGLFLPKEF
jgi:hypothetical protein